MESWRNSSRVIWPAYSASLRPVPRLVALGRKLAPGVAGLHFHTCGLLSLRLRSFNPPLQQSRRGASPSVWDLHSSHRPLAAAGTGPQSRLRQNRRPHPRKPFPCETPRRSPVSRHPNVALMIPSPSTPHLAPALRPANADCSNKKPISISSVATFRASPSSSKPPPASSLASLALVFLSLTPTKAKRRRQAQHNIA